MRRWLVAAVAVALAAWAALLLLRMSLEPASQSEEIDAASRQRLRQILREQPSP